MDFALPVTGLTGRRRVLRPGAALLCPPRLLQGLEPGAVQLHDLGAVDEAATGEGNQVGLALAPARERGRPLLRAANLVGVLAGEDHAAVDDPGDDRGELAGGDRHHRLVQQPQALLDAPEPDQDVALLVGGEREQVRVAVTLADRRGLAGGRGGRLEVAARLLLEDDRQQQVATFDTVVPPRRRAAAGRDRASRLRGRYPRGLRG